MKLLLDTNILIDLITKRAPFGADARRLSVAALFKDVQLWVTTQSYTDAQYILDRAYAKSEVRQALLETLELLIPCSVNASDLKTALESEWEEAEDYLIAHAAKRIKADFLITRDVETTAKSPVPAFAAGEFLDYLESEQGLVYEVDLEL